MATESRRDAVEGTAWVCTPDLCTAVRGCGDDVPSNMRTSTRQAFITSHKTRKMPPTSEKPLSYNTVTKKLLCAALLHYARPTVTLQSETGGAGGGDGESKAALMRKGLHDKGWAEKQVAGFTNWLNYTLVGAEQLRRGDGDANEGDDGVDGVVGEGARGVGAVSSSPLKAMVAMVSLYFVPSS